MKANSKVSKKNRKMNMLLKQKVVEMIEWDKVPPTICNL